MNTLFLITNEHAQKRNACSKHIQFTAIQLLNMTNITLNCAVSTTKTTLKNYNVIKEN